MFLLPLLLPLLLNLIAPIESSCQDEVCVFIVNCYENNARFLFDRSSNETVKSDFIMATFYLSEATKRRNNCTVPTLSKMSILPESIDSWIFSFSTPHKDWKTSFWLQKNEPLANSTQSNATDYELTHLTLSENDFWGPLNGSEIVTTKLESSNDSSVTFQYRLEAKNLISLFAKFHLSFTIDDAKTPFPTKPIVSAIRSRLGPHHDQSDPDNESDPDNKELETNEAKGVWSWVKQTYVYLLIGLGLFLLVVISLAVAICLLCKKNHNPPKRPQSNMSFQRLPGEATIGNEQMDSSPSDVSTDFHRDAGSTQAEPSKNLIAKSEASKTGEVTETEQRLDRIHTAR